MRGARAAMAVVAAALLAAGPQGEISASTPDPPDTLPPATDSEGNPIDNEFMDDEQIEDCTGLLERPGCGSDERGGWRQGAVFGAIAVAMGIIGWRIVRAVRR